MYVAGLANSRVLTTVPKVNHKSQELHYDIRQSRCCMELLMVSFTGSGAGIRVTGRVSGTYEQKKFVGRM